MAATLLAVLLLATSASSSSSSTTSTTLLTFNSTLISPNNTFQLGFFSPTSTTFFLGIWYSSIPLRTYVWVANRRSPLLHPNATLSLTPSGRLALFNSAGVPSWSSDNTVPADSVHLLDNGNLVLLSGNTTTLVWQSFDHPSDTWLPGMPITRRQLLTCWRSPSDPSLGLYHLRLKPPVYGEFELLYRNASGTGRRLPYWSTGNWVSDRFARVPEMTVPYIYDFRFDDPYTAAASFLYTVKPAAAAVLTRFAVDSSGLLRQYTWSAQAESWYMFWSRPEDPCDVPRQCGNLGFCGVGGFRPCQCLTGFRPMDPAAWESGDFSGGCRIDREQPCDGDVEFMEIDKVELDVESWVTHRDVGKDECESLCRKSCPCVGMGYNSNLRVCKTMVGTVTNLKNSTVPTSTGQALFLKVPASLSTSPPRISFNWRTIAITSGSIGVFLVALGLSALIVFVLLRSNRRHRMNNTKKKKKKRSFRDDETEAAQNEEEASVSVTTSNLQVFTYKELSAATKAFSEKLGHGGFGAVFLGELPDSTPIAVKRLERPGGGGDREFRAEVRTIGSIQHVNLVRLRGFCSDDPHRILVYDYMPKGPLSSYLRHGSAAPTALPWDVRFRIAVGTARGIAYLHEECRDCIIHCDIKPENILLDGDFAPKVSDFGLAKLVGRDFSRVLTTMRGTWGYVAPEWISGVAITSKADVYSYGMTLLEIIAGRRNVDAEGQMSGDRWFLPPWAAREIVAGNVGAVVAEGEYREAEAERAGRVAVWCIQDQEVARPTMGMVAKMLEGTVEVSVPPLPHLLQSLVSGDSFPKEGILSAALSASTASTGSDGRIPAVDCAMGGDGSGNSGPCSR